MGKGNRNKLQRDQKTNEVDQYLTRSEKVKKKSDTRNGKIIAAICLVLVIAVLLILVCSVLNSVGAFMRMTTVLKMQDGHYKVNKAMMNFFFNEQIMNWYSQYGSFATYLGLDFGKDLRSQEYSAKTASAPAVTWYDYFLSQTKSQVQLYLAYANAAYDMGLKLDDEDKQEIKDTIAALDEYIGNLGLKYSHFYGEGVSKGDIKDCYEIIYLANKYSEVMTEKYKEELEKDDSSVKTFPENNKESFYTADVLQYEIKVDSKGMTDAEYDNGVAKAKERAQTIAAAKTAEEFFELIKADLKAIEAEKTDKDEGPSDSADKATEKSTEKSTEAVIDDYKNTIEYTTSGGDLENWLFGIEKESSSEKRDPAKKGETFTEEATETYTEKATTSNNTEKTTETPTEATKYKKFTVTAYCVYEEMGLDTDLTRNLGYFITSDKATADKILADFKAGTLSADALDKLGKAAADALPKDSTISIGHSAPKQVAPGYFKNNKFDKIDDWLDEEGRKPGDVSDVFELETTSSSSSTEKVKYYAVVYFEEYDKEVWYVNATTGRVNQMFEHWYQGEDGNGGKLASNPVKYNEKEANDLHQTIVPYLLNSLSSSTSTTK